jgi:putative hydrolase of the HAD superfamily
MNTIKDYKNIRNIIFDFGNVIIDLDFDRCIAEFEKIGFKNVAEKLSSMSAFEDSFLKQFEIGKVSNDKFRDQIRNKIGDKNLKDESIDYAWNSMLGTIPQERYDLLNELKNKFNLYLLSNTNKIHCDLFTEKFNYSKYFKKEYYSHEIKIRKPNKEAFKLILEEQNIKANETLFIDDLAQNILAAKELGFQVFLHNPFKRSIIDFFKS